MKRIIITLFAFMACGEVWGQNLINESRKFVNPVDLKEYGDTKSNKADSIKSIKIGSKFTIVDTDGDNYKIYFWNWKITKEQSRIDEKGNNQITKAADSTSYKAFNYDTAIKRQRYFLIPKNDIDVHAVKIYDRWSAAIGTLVFPFKYRFNQKTFEPTFSLNLIGGVTFNPYWTNRHTFSLMLGVGPSSSVVNKHNTNNGTDIEGDLTLVSVSTSANLVYQYDFVQFGISLGWDHLMNNHKYEWQNQGKPWIAFGVGMNLLKKTDKTASPTSN